MPRSPRPHRVGPATVIRALAVVAVLLTAGCEEPAGADGADIEIEP